MKPVSDAPRRRLDFYEALRPPLAVAPDAALSDLDRPAIDPAALERAARRAIGASPRSFAGKRVYDPEQLAARLRLEIDSDSALAPLRGGLGVTCRIIRAPDESWVSAFFDLKRERRGAPRYYRAFIDCAVEPRQKIEITQGYRQPHRPADNNPMPCWPRTIEISAIDSQGVANFFKSNGPGLSQTIATAIRKKPDEPEQLVDRGYEGGFLVEHRHYEDGFLVEHHVPSRGIYIARRYDPHGALVSEDAYAKGGFPPARSAAEMRALAAPYRRRREDGDLAPDAPATEGDLGYFGTWELTYQIIEGRLKLRANDLVTGDHSESLQAIDGGMPPLETIELVEALRRARERGLRV